MKAPRKSEMLRLQAQYKTDAKIADALGVAEYLVSYWRRKKRLPRHSAPKFTKDQVLDVWQRYADDFRGGRELGISKAAFYGWRRKYGIFDRPAALKLEQLELRLPGQMPAAAPGPVPKTATRKVLEGAGLHTPTGLCPDWRISESDPDLGGHWVFTPGTGTPASLTGRPEPIPYGGDDAPIELNEEMGQPEWQLIEARAVRPGQMLVGPSRLAAGVGGIGCLYLPNGLDPANLRVLRAEVTRRLSDETEVEDILIALLGGGMGANWNDSVVEFLGPPIEALTVDRKAKLCALAVQAGAQAALCAFDDVTRRYFGRLLQNRYPQCHPDRSAIYDGEFYIEPHTLNSSLVGISRTGVISPKPVSADEKMGILIGPHALPYEIELTALTLKGGRIAGGNTLLVCPATPGAYRKAQESGWQQAILDAGGSVLDVALARRLGVLGLLKLAAGANRRVGLTRPPDVPLPPDAPELLFGSARVLTESLALLS